MSGKTSVDLICGVVAGVTALNALAPLHGAAAPRFDLIAQAGQVVGGSPVGLPFNPLINQDGDVAFLTNASGLEGSEGTLFKWSRLGDLQRVAGAGSLAAGLPAGVTFTPTRLNSFNRRGETLVTARLTGSGVTALNDSALIHLGENGATLLSREGTVVPGGTIQEFNSYGILDAATSSPPRLKLDDPSLNDNGYVAFAAHVSVDQRRDVLLAGMPGSISVIASQNTIAPGNLSGSQPTYFKSFNNNVDFTPEPSAIDLRPDNTIVFCGRSVASPSSPPQYPGMWQYSNGTIQPIVVTETYASTGVPRGASKMRTNGSGLVYLESPSVTTNYERGQWVIENQTPRRLTAPGDAIPGVTGTSLPFTLHWVSDGPAITASGMVVSNLVFADERSAAIVFDEHGRRAILTTGDALPSNNLGWTDIDFATFPSANTSDQLIGVGQVGNAAGTLSGDALFVGDPRKMRPMLLSGQSFKLSNGDTKTLSPNYFSDGSGGFGFDNFLVSSGWDAGRLKFNDRSEFPWLVQFADGSRGLLLVTAPPPVPGDTNFDDHVTFDDLLALAQNYGESNTAILEHGDFDYDGDVDFADLLTLAQHYESAATQADDLALTSSRFQSDWTLARNLVPEPAAISAFLLSAAVVRRRRARFFAGRR